MEVLVGDVGVFYKVRLFIVMFLSMVLEISLIIYSNMIVNVVFYKELGVFRCLKYNLCLCMVRRLIIFF